MSVQIHQSDVLEWAQGYAGVPFHALLADAPYEIDFMGSGKKGWWDNSNISFRPDTWKALAQHLLPGAFLFVFGGSRTYHRLACALEDAGLILHPAIGYCFGAGFPKATRIPDERFTGHRYGRQALKPAFEFIAVAQVPYAGRPVDSITATGAGSLWIDGGRLATYDNTSRHTCQQMTSKDTPGGSYANPDRIKYAADEPLHTGGGKRWPPNLALCHTPQCQRIGTQQVPGTHPIGPHPGRLGYHGADCSSPSYDYTAPDGTETVAAWECTEECPIRMLDEQAGSHKAGGAKDCRGQANGYVSIRSSIRDQTYASYGDTGPVSRFFSVHDWFLDVAEQLAGAAPLYYASKASPRERSQGVNARNTNPCIKPLSLCRWLATLLLPPAAYAPRRLLAPFAGSGSEMIGAMLAGWDEVCGIEASAEYCDIARQRLAYWQAQPQQGVLL